MALLPSVASPMHGAMVPIARAVGTGSTFYLSFTNIPQIYQDLFLVCYGLTASGDFLTLNSVNSYSPNISQTTLEGNGTSASSSRASARYAWYLQSSASTNMTSTIPQTAEIHILNYSNTSTYKTLLGRYAIDANGSGNTGLTVGMVSTTSGISSFSIATGYGNNFTTNATFTLYGIRTVGQ